MPPRDGPCKIRGQDGFAVLLSCRALSSPTTCRFIPAHSESPTIQTRSRWRFPEKPVLNDNVLYHSRLELATDIDLGPFFEIGVLPLVKRLAISRVALPPERRSDHCPVIADNPRTDRTDLRRLQRTHPHRRIGLSNTFAQTISEPECFRLSRRSECANQHGCLFDAGVLQAFDKLFTPSLTLRKLRPRFFNYNVWQCVPGGAPLSYA